MTNWLFKNVLKLTSWRLATGVGVLVLLAFILCLSWLYRQAEHEQLATVRQDEARLAKVLANEVDGDLHKQLVRTDQTGSALYRQVIEPLIKAHSQMPDVYYLYTMVHKKNELYFILDTAVYAKEVSSPFNLQPSKVMELYQTVDSRTQQLVDTLDSGGVYVSAQPHQDSYGEFLSALAPIYDSSGTIVAYLGVDISAATLAERMAHIRYAFIGSVAAAVLLSLLLAFLTYRVRQAAAAQEARRAESEHYARQHARRTELIINSIMDGVLGLGTNGSILTMSQVAADMWHLSAEDVLHQSFTRLIDGPDQAIVLSAIERASRGQHSQLQVRGRRGTEVFPLNLVISPGLEGEDARFVVTARDLSRDMAMEDEGLMAAQVFSTMNDAVIITDAEGRILMVNEAFTRITGYAKEDVKGQPASTLRCERHDDSFYASLINRIEQTGHWQGELFYRRQNGEVFPLSASIKALYDRQQRITRLVGVFTDVTLRKEQEQRLHDLANNDSLTRLPNRSTFRRHFDELLSEARGSGKGFAVLLMDVDGFKRINESLGHTLGDKVLQQLSKRLEGLQNMYELLARVGGDRFGLLIRAEEMTEMLPLVNRLLNLQKTPFTLNDHEVEITLSIGISRYPTDGHDSETLYKQADIALFEAKSSGGNTYQFFTTAMHVRALERTTLEAQLHHALQRKEIRLIYQPQICINDGHLISMEARLIWGHPELGDIDCERFLPVAEEAGLIGTLTSWTLDKMCQQMSLWHERNIRIPKVSTALSERQVLLGNQLLRLIDETSLRYGLERKYIELEIPETVLTDPGANVRATMDGLKNLGVSLMVNQFGMGEGSITGLRRFELKKIKLPRALVQRLPEDEEACTLVRAIIGMGSAWKALVLADGVETAEQLIFLQENGCDGVQGLLYSPPLESGAVEQFYHQFQLSV
ncbi:putative bifunctional diguanylate cyclase/phosphodiesterase [Pokkaliibacter sp. CJK22405]|uniref:putative bifunctional diguanylate cyclase/phosphodiesterase n=1 Tax=Pokkaliibacter sp. CJK22405 TaxID=3384615 RepID=UPI00398567C1